jgi:hypothetical protein
MVRSQTPPLFSEIQQIWSGSEVSLRTVRLDGCIGLHHVDYIDESTSSMVSWLLSISDELCPRESPGFYAAFSNDVFYL